MSQPLPVDATTGQPHHFPPVQVPPERPQPKRVPTAVITRPGDTAPPPTTRPGDTAPPPTTRPGDSAPPPIIDAEADRTREPTTLPASHTVHVPNSSPTNQTPVVPATSAEEAPEHALPTAPTVHPEAQARELDNVGQRDPGLVAAQVEKSKGDKRDVLGKEPKGTVVQGIEDDRLWALLRRFDVQVNHTLILTSQKKLPPWEPDLRRSVLPHVPFNSDILKANMERLYAGAGVGLIRAVNELARLRSWHPAERRRTTYFCATYFFAWCLGLAIPTLLMFLITLTVLPESRAWFFPPVMPPPGQPPSATDPLNRKGDESFLGGVDSAVQHRSKAEQVEEQAWEFRQLAEAFAVRIAVSKGAKTNAQGNAAMGEKRSARQIETSSSSSDSDLDEFADAYGHDPDAVDAEIDPSLYAPGEHPSELARQQRQLRGDRHDRADDPAHQGMTGKTTKKIDAQGREVEKPMSEKHRKHAEAKEAKAKRDAVIGKYTKVMQDVTGDMADLSECFANALSPPRPYPPNIARFKLAGAILAPILLATAFIKDTGPDPDSELVDEAGNYIDPDDLGTKDKIAHKSKSKLVNSFKAVSKRVAAIGADVTVDGVRKKVGTKVDRVIFGDVLNDDGDEESYPCKLRSKPGHIIIRPMSAYGPATLIFEPLVGPPIFERPVDDVVELKKGGVSMPRAVLGWASGADIESQTLLIRLKNEFEKQVGEIAKDVKGMQVQDGEIYELNQVVRREQLFNRLIAMGNQRWESL
ncbi:hypothetical protein QFC19_007662 [Naganishia cerealis]|uniref:Uncharacterized protein n=1 Tax=Naganishia cerealis TaxID=610337 RepID=A0ACC2V9J8_9TREE|nr:hypothetical protein QFC19_007662 [Naganishia cerealis]